MKNFFKSALGGCIATLSVLSSGSIFAQTPVTVVEYYNKTVASYFITARVDEIALLDANPALYARTGMTFGTFSATSAPSGYLPVCRYQTLIPPSGYSTHFYGLPTDCTYIAETVARLNLQNYRNEGLDFATLSPDTSGACPANSPIPVYRSFRKLSPVDTSNHRYSVSQTAYNEMKQRGWAAEGAVFCATSATPATARPLFAAASTLKNRCAAPRVGTSPITGQVYPDAVGTVIDEKSFLRSFTDQTYLWYREVDAPVPSGAESVATYFAALKTESFTNSFTPTGANRKKDEFHFTQATEAAEQTQAGLELSYGIDWSAVKSTPPRNWIAAVIAPGSPADLAGVKRGDKLLKIAGVDFVSGSNVTAINAALLPRVAGQAVNFEFAPANGGPTRAVTMTGLEQPIVAVPKTSVVSTPTGKVGYLALTTFNTFTAEDNLVNAFSGLAGQGLSDLVLDLRYNSGGYVYISSQLAYMIAGPARTSSKAYSLRRVNDKTQVPTPFPFFSTTFGYGGLAADLPLPTLNLPRVYVLTSKGSCSASESFINGLKGIDVEVIMLGDTTCGKPYGFSREDNCGTSYFSIQTSSANAKGEGDYINGFAPRCSVSDDLTQDLGSPQEKQFAAALQFRSTGSCPSASGVANKRSTNTEDTPESGGLRNPRAGSFQIALDSVPANAKVIGSRAIEPVFPEQVNLR
jgi:carboxyl-terminal processing protease